MKIKITYIVSRLIPVGPIFSLRNIISNLPKDKFQVTLITLNENNNQTIIDSFQQMNIKIYPLGTSKIKTLICSVNDISKVIKGIQPEIIHSHGLMADYVNSKLKIDSLKVTTLRCFPYEDFINNYGKILGSLVIKFFMKNMRNIDNRVACSVSLSERIKERTGMDFIPIPNGLDITNFGKYKAEDKNDLRKKLKLPLNKKIFISVGNISQGKDPGILVDVFISDPKDHFLILLGDGPLLESLKSKTIASRNIKFTGKVSNVDEYLGASDFFISASHSEGLPNAVLEAMGSRLPVILSDIPAHKEILEKDPNCGFLFKVKNKESLYSAIKKLESMDYKLMMHSSETIINNYFTAKIMSNNYANYYKTIIKK